MIEIGFPYVNALDKFSVELNYSEDFFQGAMTKIAERVDINRRDYPLPEDAVVTREAVQHPLQQQVPIDHRISYPLSIPPH